MPRRLSARRYSRQFTERAVMAQRRAVLLSSSDLLEQSEIYLVQLGHALQLYRETTDQDIRLQLLLEAESSAEIMTALLGVLRHRRYEGRG